MSTGGSVASEPPRDAAGADGLPELTFDLARELGEFPEYVYPVTQTDIDAYCEITGDDPSRYTEIVPPGLAAIFGRQGYLRLHSMPPGGVLLGQTITWLRPAKRGVDLLIKARVVSAEEKDGRRKLVFETTARQGGEPVATVEIVAGWPK